MRRGVGLGRAMLGRGTRFADALGYDPLWLTTFRGLDAACRLHEAAGFALTYEADVDQWQGGVREQTFQRRRPHGAPTALDSQGGTTGT